MPPDPLFDDVHQAFVFSFPSHEHDTATLDAIARAVVGKSLDALTPNTGLDQRIYELLKLVEAEGKLDSVIVEAHKRARRAPIEALYVKYCGKQPDQKPFDAFWIPPGKALLDRENIRRATRRLVTGEIRVLLINGPRRSGKSYCSTLMRYVSEASRRTPGGWSNDQQHALCEIDLKDHGPLIKPADMLQLIGHDMGLAEVASADQVAAAPRWYRSRISGLKPKLDARRQVLWLILDGIGSVSPDDEILDFAACFAREAAKATQLRAILIDCPLERLPVELADNGDIVEETVTLVEIDDLFCFFNELGKSMKKPVKAKELAHEVWQEIAPLQGKDSFMAALAVAARKRAVAITEG